MLQAPEVRLGLKNHILWPSIHFAAIDRDDFMILLKVFIGKGNMAEELPLWQVPTGDLHDLRAQLFYIRNHREIALLGLILLIRVVVGLEKCSD